MLTKIVGAFEWLVYRLFCGAERWEVQYTIYFATGYHNGVHTTFKSLSKYTGNFEAIGFDLAKEIASEMWLKTGIVATECKIISVRRVW